MELFDEETYTTIMKGDNPLEFPGLKFTMSTDDSKALKRKSRTMYNNISKWNVRSRKNKTSFKTQFMESKQHNTICRIPSTRNTRYSIVHGAKKVKIFGEEIAVNARIEYIEGYSGHADQEGLMNFIFIYRNQNTYF